MLTVTHLKTEHLWLGLLPYFCVGLLAAGCLGSLWLAFQLVLRSTGKISQKWNAGIGMLWPVGLMATVWTLVFFVW
jgi:hypothetical protein